MGEDIIDASIEVLNNNKSLQEISQTFITLIPKSRNLENITQFRTISLCNVLYKIISKTIANRLKEVMHEIISEYQGALIINRQISYIIIKAHELLRFMKLNKTNKHYIAIKLDMSKTYDRVE